MMRLVCWCLLLDEETGQETAAAAAGATAADSGAARALITSHRYRAVGNMS